MQPDAALLACDLPLPSTPASVREARRFVVGLARQAEIPQDVIDVAALAVSEIVTNAVVHGAPPVTLAVAFLDGALLFSVPDSSAAPLVLSTPEDDVDRGRGLPIVDATAQRWGYELDADAQGKTVWFTLDV